MKILEPDYHDNEMNLSIELEVRGKKEKMPFDQFVRWGCLIEAMDMISKKCDELKLERQDTSWIKPGAINKYINDRYLSLKYQIERELKTTSSHQCQAI